MKKRLRKKLHKKEFQKTGYRIQIILPNRFKANQTCNEFIDFVENINLCIGGNFCDKEHLEIDIVLETDKRYGHVNINDFHKFEKFVYLTYFPMKFAISGPFDLYYDEIL